MKAIKLFLFCFLGTTLLGMGKAQEAKLPFEGTIQYRIAYESPLIPQEQLAQQPQVATLRVLGEKALFSMAEQKVLADASTKELHTLVNLSAMGIGKYHIVETQAELQEESDQTQNIKVEKTSDTKTIFGYTAHLTKVSYKEGNTSVEMDVWSVDGFCDPFLNHASQAGGIKDMEGFPLEYTLKTPDMTMAFTVHKLTSEIVNEKYFNIPSSYKASTKEEMQKDIQEVMRAFQQ